MKQIAFALACLLLIAPAVVADDWEDPRAQALEDAVRDLEREALRARADAVADRYGFAERPTPTPVRQDAIVSMRTGEVRLVADLARTDVTVLVHNPTGQPLEWRSTFAIDPAAEVIGAVLAREGQDEVAARTLRDFDAQSLYAQAKIEREIDYGDQFASRPPRWWGPGTPATGGGDPLLVERLSRKYLRVTVFPVNPSETLRVALTFVSPLRGRGEERRYVDVVQEPIGPVMSPSLRPGPVTAPDALPARNLAVHGTEWFIEPGTLRLADRPEGMVVAGAQGERLHLVGSTRPSPDAPATVSFVTEETGSPVVAVPGGGIGTHVATWRFDAIGFLLERGVRPAPGTTLRLVRRSASTMRIAPWTFELAAEPVPVTALVTAMADEVRYGVEVVDRDGNVLQAFDVRRDIERQPMDEVLGGAITGWHRAVVVSRVLEWAAGDFEREQQALDHAVDVGVLVPGVSAVAIPRNEQDNLFREQRRQYRHDGTTLGAQGRQADLKAPPTGSTSP
jgi:hypothetical protein